MKITNYSPDNIFYYLELVKKWKRFILVNVLVVTIASAIIALILPNWYYSSAVIKPAESGSVSLFSAVLGSKGLSGIGKNLNIGGLQYSDLDYYQSLLLSRTLQLKIIKQFNLKQLYGNKYTFQTIDELTANSVFQIDTKSNMLMIGVNDKDPIRAKKMVESYIVLLDSTLKNLTEQPLKNDREFVEKRYLQNLADIKNAEDSLNLFQKRNGVIIPEEQLGGTFKAVAEVEAQKLFIESQLSSVILTQGEDSPGAKSLKGQISTLQKELSRLKSSEVVPNAPNAFVPIGAAPGLMKQYVRLYRNLEIQNKLLEMLYPLYEQSKMEESKNRSQIVVIDNAYVPEYKVKPKRAIIIGAGFGLSLLFTVIFVVVIDYVKKLKSQAYSK